MRKICLTIEYDGTDFVGWQLQPNGLSVQEVVEAALADLVKHSVRLNSASRTDAGVHARGMDAHFITKTDLPLSAYREGLNGRLPPSVAVVAARVVGDKFNARYESVSKWYRYKIIPGEIRSPLNRHHAWFVHSQLDLKLMRQAAADFVGRHDFSSFRTSGCSAKTTIREISSIDISTFEGVVVIDVRGSGFLRNMVRMMVGTLAEIAWGKRPVNDVSELLAGRGSRASTTAPAHGLCLMRIEYADEAAVE